MSIREQLVQELERLSEDEVEQLAEYLAFVKYRTRLQAKPQVDEEKLAALYAEFAAEDREIAEQGMADYAEALAGEDDE